MNKRVLDAGDFAQVKDLLRQPAYSRKQNDNEWLDDVLETAVARIAELEAELSEVRRELQVETESETRWADQYFHENQANKKRITKLEKQNTKLETENSQLRHDREKANLTYKKIQTRILNTNKTYEIIQARISTIQTAINDTKYT